MIVENDHLPCDKQDIDDLEDTQELIDYLEFGVGEGLIDEDIAQNLIEGGKWDAIREMMFKGDEYYEEVI